MTMIKHSKNTFGWHAKNGDAKSEQVAAFAKEYQKEDASAHMVALTEGADWISADHVRHVMAATREEGAVKVWVSDGTFAQCVWGKDN